MIEQAGIYGYTTAAGGGQVLVVSNNEINEHDHPVALVIQDGEWDLPPYLVPLTDQDPAKGSINVNMILFTDASMYGPLVGTVTGATWRRVREALDAMFEE